MRYPIYSSSHNDHWRYLLGKEGGRPLFVVGLNPHTATQLKPDNTVAKAEKLADIHRYEGFVMLNLYPVRSKTVNDLPIVPDASALARNEREILAAIGKAKNPHVWAAWGNDIRRRDYLRQSAASLMRKAEIFKPVWLYFGALTVKGHPRHPSRVSYAWGFGKFDAKSYLPIIDA